MTQLRRLLGLAMLVAFTAVIGCGDGGSGVVPKGPENGPKLEQKTPGGAPGGKKGSE